VRRSILTSLVVIGAVVALVMGATTFAVFTETNTLTNAGAPLSSGSFDLVLTDEESTTVLSFSPVETAACANMADGDACATTFTVTNGGSLEFIYTGSVSEAGDVAANCFVPTLALTEGNGGDAQPTVDGTDFDLALAAAGDGGNGDALDPDGETDTYTLTVTLTAPVDNSIACQGIEDVVYTVSVTATQSASPQD
jgi:hypothetical protein